MPAFLNRNERRNAATIEVAERPESPLVVPAGTKSPIPSMQLKSYMDTLKEAG